MAFTKLFAAAALLSAILTSALPQTAYPSNPPPGQQFNLQPLITAGDSSIFPARLFITTQHTGAGTSAAVAVTNQTIAAIFTFNETRLGIYGGNVPYTVGLTPSPAYLSNAPPSYSIVTVNAGLYTTGFSLNPGNMIEYSGGLGFTSFALCSVNGTAPYFSLGPDYQLFWKNASSVASAGNCADVKLAASFVTPGNTG